MRGRYYNGRKREGYFTNRSARELRHALFLLFRGFSKMRRASTVGALLLIPAVAVARNPGVEFSRYVSNAGNQKHPSHPAPSGQQQSNASPRIHAAKDAPLRVHRLHPDHGLLAVHLRKSAWRLRIMEVKQFDTAEAVEPPHVCRARTAKRAGSIKQHGQLRHSAISFGCKR